jgi:3-hydroxyisobutyrate dehydrogenase/glyoxylate/succinic semialdehyde reductase
MKTAFIGLGIMGSRMAANLLKADPSPTVFNRSNKAAEPLCERGARSASSAAEAVKEADVVFTMLSTPDVVREVALGASGFVPAMKHNAIWVDCSTVNPSFSREMAKAARDRGVRFVDAPVAGSKPNAENGDLVFLAGGEQADLAAIEPFLNVMGARTVHAGATGQGSAFKMLVNAMLAQAMLVFSDTVLLGESLGFDRDFLLNTLPGMPVSAPFTRAKAEMIRSGDFGVNFPMEWMHKDLHLAALTAFESGQPLVLANLAKELYAGACREGLGREDFSAIYKFLKGKS